MITIFIILSALVLVNILLLIFSCNDAENKVKEKNSSKRKNLFYRPNTASYKVLFDK